MPASEAFDATGNLNPEFISMVEDLMTEYADDFASGRAFLGGWHNPNDGMVEVNVTFVFNEDRYAEAVAFAEQNDQIAIADLSAIARGDWANAIIETGGSGGASRGG